MCVIIKISNIQNKMSSTILEQEIFKFQEALMRTGQYWFDCPCCEKIILSGEDDTYEDREEVEGEYICGDCIETINWCPCCGNEELIDEEDSYCQTCLIRISNGKEGDSSYLVNDKVNNKCWKPRKKD